MTKTRRTGLSTYHSAWLEKKPRRLTKDGLLRWAYSKPDGVQCGGVSFIANVIHCHYSEPYRLLKGLHALVTDGHEVRSGNTIDQVSIDGQIQPITNLKNWG